MINRMFKQAAKRGFLYPFYILRNGRPLQKDGFRILLYHSIGPCQKNDYMGLKVSQKEFMSQMEFLKKNNFIVYNLAELVDKLIHKAPVAANSIAITFDDGYKDILFYAVPILKEFGYTATIFMTTDYIGARMRRANARDYWKGWDFLSQEDLRLLERSGFNIESHSTDFFNLQMINREQVVRNVANSKNNLEVKLAKRITIFGYPSGGTEGGVRSVLKEAGFKAAVCSIPGHNDSNADLFMLRRTEISRWDSMLDFRLKVFGYYDWVKYVSQK